MDEWKRVFYNNVSIYLSIINKELSNRYETSPLNKHIQLLGGYAFKSAEYKKQGIPIIRISDYQDEQINLTDVVYYDEASELEKYELKSGDIIIALTGATIGKLAIVQKGLGKLYLNQRVAKFKVLNPKAFIHEYVYWIARGVESKIKELAWGGAQPNVSTRQIEVVEFPIPDINTQLSIVEFLNDLKNNTLQNKVYFQDVIERKILQLHYASRSVTALNDKHYVQADYLKQLRQVILQEAIEGKLTAEWRKQNHALINGDNHASKLLEKIKAEKERLIKEGKIKKDKPLAPISDDEKPFDLPDSWAWCRLGELIVYSENLDIQKKLPPSTIINYVDIDSIDNKRHKIAQIKTKKVSELSSRARRVLKKGYIVYSTVRPYLENIAFVEKEVEHFIGSTGFNVFKALLIDQKYIFNLLLSPYINKLYQEMMVGFNSPSITNEQFEDTAIPLPPLTEQQAIVDIVKKLMNMIDELEKQVTERKNQSEMLMQSVLREAFAG